MHLTAVDVVGCTVTVGVDLASLAGVGKRWRTSSRQFTGLALRFVACGYHHRAA